MVVSLLLILVCFDLFPYMVFSLLLILVCFGLFSINGHQSFAYSGLFWPFSHYWSTAYRLFWFVLHFSINGLLQPFAYFGLFWPFFIYGLQPIAYFGLFWPFFSYMVFSLSRLLIDFVLFSMYGLEPFAYFGLFWPFFHICS